MHRVGIFGAPEAAGRPLAILTHGGDKMPGGMVFLRCNGDHHCLALIGGLPNIYLYAANNPSEASLAKRRSNAVTITHLTPPLAQGGLYKGLLDLKDSLTRWRQLAPGATERGDLEALIAELLHALRGFRERMRSPGDKRPENS